ncbi:protein NRT1/ PTR FAMILY 4.2-like [Pyrus x bretschneideri]|uniref:protein NRT1/ PTR FAMILY 4.2-like n=1 Tax=Pyrus x bretschneideri TaxID=225117 RepID=UPI00202E0E44|nr:protein NRT1/ PTR FAMILY 4.2-like [Pyrus x bretschneideri]
MALEISTERDGNVLYEQKESDDQFVDWRGREANPKKHGGIRAAALTCVVGVLINMVFLSNAINFVSYFRLSMHYSPATSANMVTNFMGTSFLLSIVGGFICDSLFTSFTTFIIFCAINLVGVILLAIQAQFTHLRPAVDVKPSLFQATILYIGLYAFAAGIAGLNVALPAHGADQLDHNDARLISAFLNWFNFAICLGGLISSTVMVWVEDHIGWNWSFLITVTALSFSLVIFVTGTPFYRHKRPTAGNSLARIITVLACAARNWKASSNERMGNQYAVSPINRSRADGQSYDKLKFLDKALIGNTISVAHVDETRTFLGLLPIFASTIMMNCCLAQVETFSVVQGSKMNRKLHNFEIPTQSLNVPPLFIMLASIPLCERFQHKSHMLQPLWRIGLGIALASGSMGVAALVEAKRREAAHNDVTLPVFWLGWQFFLLGVCDVLTLGGMLEFFYSEAPSTMRSMCAALSWCSISLGYFLSSVLVSIANSVSGKFGTQWLGGDDLNHMRLDLFYTLLGILNTVNFLNYMYWAKRY